MPIQKMVFKLWIIPEVAICKETGKPHAWTTDTNEKIQDLSVLEVEEPHRKYMNLVVDYNHSRISQQVQKLNDGYPDDVNCTSLNRFLECFPEWKDEECGCERPRQDSDDEQEKPDWTYKNHNELREALEYLAKKNVAFRVEW